MASCIGGKGCDCAAWRHPSGSSGLRVTQPGPVKHMQRKPGETFAEMDKRLAAQ